MLQNFIVSLLVKAAQNPEVQKFVADQLARLVTKLKAELLPDLIALFPTFGQAVVKAALDLMPNVDVPAAVELGKGVAQNIVDSDPDIPGLSDIIDVSEILKGWLR